MSIDSKPLLTVQVTMESTLPVRGTDGAAAYDITSHGSYTLKPGTSTLVELNLALSIPAGFYLQLQSRSSLALKGVVTVGGVIDRYFFNISFFVFFFLFLTFF